MQGKKINILDVNQVKKIDIDNSKLDLEYLKLSRFMEHSEDLEIHDANILFLGLCSRCKEEEKCQDQQSLEE